MANPAITFKQGATLTISAVLQLDDGTPVDLTGATITASFRDTLGTVLKHGTITLAAATGACLISLSPADTAVLPTGMIFSDVSYQLASGVLFSQTYPLRALAPVGGP